ncbi:MAG: glycosyltransferase family 2 protein [Actinomycetota bacterium]
MSDKKTFPAAAADRRSAVELDKKLISITVPVYQEQEVIKVFHEELARVIDQIEGFLFEIIYINDGSTDQTEAIITEIAKSDDRVTLINLSRNFGHQYALTCGLDYASGDAVICMDADLQHPPNLIPLLVQKWQEGYDIVYTIRKMTVKTGLFKALTANMFYRLINTISEVPIYRDAADFRLISRKVADVFRKEIRERNRFLRGLTSWVGFNSTGIEFDVQRRAAGKSKFSPPKMLKLASAGGTSFSTIPLKIGIYVGLLFAFLSVLYAFYAIYIYLFTDGAVPGWTSIVVSIMFISAFQFMLIGILGLYIGHMFEEVKGRPIYIVRSVVRAGCRLPTADRQSI